MPGRATAPRHTLRTIPAPTGQTFLVTVKPGGGAGWPPATERLARGPTGREEPRRKAVPAFDLAAVASAERGPDAHCADRPLHKGLLRAAVDLRADLARRHLREGPEGQAREPGAGPHAVRKRPAERVATQRPALVCRGRL